MIVLCIVGVFLRLISAGLHSMVGLYHNNSNLLTVEFLAREEFAGRNDAKPTTSSEASCGN